MRGFVIKMHYDQSADDAYFVRKLHPGARGVRRHRHELRDRRHEPGRDSPDGGRQRRLGTHRVDADLGRASTTCEHNGNDRPFITVAKNGAARCPRRRR